jgi:hypothetical protein
LIDALADGYQDGLPRRSLLSLDRGYPKPEGGSPTGLNIFRMCHELRAGFEKTTGSNALRVSTTPQFGI